MKKLKSKVLLAIVAGMTSLSLGACSDSDGDAPTPNETNTVVYKIIGSADVNISTVVYYDGTSPLTKTGDFGSTWTSEPVTVGKAYTIVAANGTGESDQSTLKAQILIDGKVVKENNVSTGKVLSTNLAL